MASLTFSSIEELQRHLNERMAQLPKALELAAWKIAEETKTILVRYPPRNTGPVKWASAKQRRYYFWLRRSQGLPLKYTRRADPMSQRLGQSWARKRQPLGAELGTKATYALWVQSAEYQQAMHLDTGWTTDEMAVAKIMSRGIIALGAIEDYRGMERSIVPKHERERGKG